VLDAVQVEEEDEHAFFFGDICSAVSAGAMLFVQQTRSIEIKLFTSLADSTLAGIFSRHSGHVLPLTLTCLCRQLRQ
jgi:hypothetical protein